MDLNPEDTVQDGGETLTMRDLIHHGIWNATERLDSFGLDSPGYPDAPGFFYVEDTPLARGILDECGVEHIMGANNVRVFSIFQ